MLYIGMGLRGRAGHRAKDFFGHGANRNGKSRPNLASSQLSVLYTIAVTSHESFSIG